MNTFINNKSYFSLYIVEKKLYKIKMNVDIFTVDRRGMNIASFWCNVRTYHSLKNKKINQSAAHSKSKKAENHRLAEKCYPFNRKDFYKRSCIIKSKCLKQFIRNHIIL